MNIINHNIYSYIMIEFIATPLLVVTDWFIITPWFIGKYYTRAFYHKYWKISTEFWDFFPGMTYYKALQIMDICEEKKCKEARIVQTNFLDMRMIKIIDEHDNIAYISICSCCWSVGVLND